MAFSTPLFIFIFLPVTLLAYFLGRGRLRSILALVISLLFFTWGNPLYLLPMAVLVLVNFFLGQKFELQPGRGKRAEILLIFSIVLNLAVLVFFKVFANRGVNTITQFGLEPIRWEFLSPLGLSYIAFQVVSYLVDVHDEKCASEKNLINFSLYLFLYPKLIAGPITPYRDIKAQLSNPQVNIHDVSDGLRRFIAGLAKKLLIADQLAKIVDPAFALSAPDLRPLSAWLVIAAYALQLYFDFSGYTDMALGLGRAMGFKLVENFNYPYIARSLSDFWRRWHISLVNWFREYVFYPLEFSSRKRKFFRQQINILTVFLLTGLWHGFTFNFLVWGVIHGLGLALEMTPRFGRRLKSIWAPLQHFYTLLVVLVGWVFFRSPNIPFEFSFLKILFSANRPSSIPLFADLYPIPLPTVVALILGIIFCLPVARMVSQRYAAWSRSIPFFGCATLEAARDFLYILLMVTSILFMVNSTHQAYIYMRF